MKKFYAMVLVLAFILLPSEALANTICTNTDPLNHDTNPIEQYAIKKYRQVTYHYTSDRYPPFIYHREYIAGIYYSGTLTVTRVVSVSGEFKVTYSGYIQP